MDELVDSAPPDVDLPEATSVVRIARDAGLGLYADLKTLTPAAASWLVGILHEEGMSERTILASSDDVIVRSCADVAPDIPRAVLFGSPDADPIVLADSANANFVHPCWESLPNPHEQLAQGWLDRVRHHGIGVICWHEERRPVVEGLWSLGVDGVCTDEPELLTSVATEST